MKNYYKVIVILLLTCFSQTLMAQSESDGVIKIRKLMVPKKPNYNRPTLGIRIGQSMAKGLSEENKLNMIYYFALDRFIEFNKWNSPYGSSGNMDEIFFVHKPVQYNITMSIPLKKHFSFYGEIGYRTYKMYKAMYHHLAYDPRTPYPIYYNYNIEFRYAQLEVPLMIQAHVKWGPFIPYANIGICPVKNVLAQSITTIDTLVASDSFKKEMEANGFDTANKTRNMDHGKLTMAIAAGLGFKISISKKINFIADYRFNHQLGKNFSLSYANFAAVKDNIYSHTISFGAEYKLKGKHKF